MCLIDVFISDIEQVWLVMSSHTRILRYRACLYVESSVEIIWEPSSLLVVKHLLILSVRWRHAPMIFFSSAANL